jgi:hypothetical protein
LAACSVSNHNDSTWNRLHDLTAEALVVEDFDGDGRDEIVISFGAAGLWRNKNGAWTRLHQAPVSALVTGRIH